MITPVERAAIAQEFRGDMLRALTGEVQAGHETSAEQLQAFRELCKDYESPGSLQLQALENRIQTLENMAATTEVKYQDGGPIMMGP